MDDRCPKCNAPKSGESCPKCGVVFAKFDVSVLEQGVPDEIKSLWRRLAENWENKPLHAVFIEKALNAGAGGYAASCYRRRGGDDPMAAEQLEKLAKRLEQMMSKAASPQKGRPSGARLVGTLILMLVLAGLALFLLMSYSPIRM